MQTSTRAHGTDVQLYNCVIPRKVRPWNNCVTIRLVCSKTDKYIVMLVQHTEQSNGEQPIYA